MLAQRLYDLDRRSAQFPEQLNELLRDTRWVEQLQHLPDTELVGLIDYLDGVRSIVTQIKSHSA